MIIIVMGVSGVGKSTIGEELAKRLGWPFYEGDAFHSDENKMKMRNGNPLDDADRQPWLRTLRHLLEHLNAQGQNAVMACSALKQSYRDLLVDSLSNIRWVYLHLSPNRIRARLEGRRHHFMSPSLLQPQLAELEEPASAIRVDASDDPISVVEYVLVGLGLLPDV